MRISDWSSDVCSSDLTVARTGARRLWRLGHAGEGIYSGGRPISGGSGAALHHALSAAADRTLPGAPADQPLALPLLSGPAGLWLHRLLARNPTPRPARRSDAPSDSGDHPARTDG